MNAPQCRNSFLKRFSLPTDNEFDQGITIKVTRKSSDFHLSHPSDYYVARKSRPFDLIPVDDKDSYFELSFRVIKIPMLSVPLLQDMQDRCTVKYLLDPFRNKGRFYIRCCDLVNIDPAQLFSVIRHIL